MPKQFNEKPFQKLVLELDKCMEKINLNLYFTQHAYTHTPTHTQTNSRWTKDLNK